MEATGVAALAAAVPPSEKAPDAAGRAAFDAELGARLLGPETFMRQTFPVIALRDG